MAAPSLILSAVRDLLRIPDSDTTFNVRLEAAFQTALLELTNATDLFATVQQIPAVATQSLYTAAVDTTRVLAVLHNRTQLMLVPSRSMDLLTTWQHDEPGDPEEWTMDKLPSAGPLQFAIHPTPLANATGAAGLTIFKIGLPLNDNPMPYVYPFLVYRVAAIFTGENTEEHDTAAQQLWSALADVWKELLTM